MASQIQFVLAGVNRFASYTYWNLNVNGAGLANMKAAMRAPSSSYADLNIYTTLLQNSVLGCAVLLKRHGSSTFEPLQTQMCTW